MLTATANQGLSGTIFGPTDIVTHLNLTITLGEAEINISRAKI